MPLTSPRFRSALIGTVATATVLALLTPPADGAVPPAGPRQRHPTAVPVAPAETLTLITGDVLHITQAQGRMAISITPAQRSTPAAFERLEHNGQIHVIPSDAAPLVRTGQLDRELFNVTGLLEQGYDDAKRSDLPLIVSRERGKRRGAGVVGAAVTADLPSVNAVAVKADKRHSRDLITTLDPGSKVWLDRKVTATDQGSNSQIGAPGAWAAGLTGSDVTVAVLDTGIDTDHPDLADKVAATANFSDDATTDDLHGHGTHVASTAAGTGSASSGAHRGVAFDARLLNGKVLNEYGSGEFSSIIDGMEWAVEQGADVVNMSLGSSTPSDGSDPLSQAVDRLTASSDTLFVVAAGNTGDTVGSPAAASSALTVGAVGADDQLAWFSSVGPREGDGAIKPDVTAPGVDIIGARARGTSGGTPIDDDHTRMSGTSMASPHVAGAAAILKQQHPDWGAGDLKAALVGSGTVNQSLTVFQQGGGRIDLSRATMQDIVATPAPLDLGYFQYPHDEAQPSTKTLTYHNHGDGDVTLELSLDVKKEKTPAPPGLITLSANSVVVPAGGTASVDVTTVPSLAAAGRWSGYLTATAKDATVQTPVGTYIEPEMYELAVTGVDRTGGPAGGASSLNVMNIDDFTTYFENGLAFVDGTVTVRVPPGNYAVMGYLVTMIAGRTTEVAMAGDPHVPITRDTALTLDARQAKRVSLSTARPTESVSDVPSEAISYAAFTPTRTAATHSWLYPPSVTGYATPTERVAPDRFEFCVQFARRSPTGHPGTPYLYDVDFPHAGAVPQNLSYYLGSDHRRDGLARIENRLHSNTPTTYGELRHHWRPYQTGSLAFLRQVPAPLVRHEYVTASDTRWQQQVRAEHHDGGEMFEAHRTYRVGAETHRWFEQPLRPAFLDGTAGQSPLPSYRQGDRLRLYMPELGDSQPGHWSWSVYYDGMRVGMRLLKDGQLLGSTDRAQGTFAIPAGAGTYRLEIDTDASGSTASWAKASTRTSTIHTFNAAQAPPDQEVPLPLLHVDYDFDLDLTNSVRRTNSHRFDFAVRHQRGSQAAPIAGARMWASYDDGASWREVRQVRSDGDGRFDVSMAHPSRAEHVTLRTMAWDTTGNRIDQTIVRTFALADG